MKIEVNERGSKNYYDEFFFIASYYRKFKKNPHKKAFKMTTFLIMYEIFIILFIAGTIGIYIMEPDAFHMCMVFTFVLCFIFCGAYLFLSNKRINEFMNSTGKKIVEINEDGIEYSDDEKNLKLKWDKIEYILVNKYSICFIPNSTTNILISLSTDYKEQAIKGIEDAGKTGLIIDNTKKN